ncbi:hypothetical protein D3C79_695800 [compost metagenome]
MQFNDIAGFASELFDQPLRRHRPFMHAVCGDAGHEQGVILHADIAIQQKDGNIGFLGFLQYGVPTGLHDGGNKDGIHTLGNKGANGLDLVLLLLLGISNFQDDTAFLCLGFGYRSFGRPPARLGTYL